MVLPPEERVRIEPAEYLTTMPGVPQHYGDAGCRFDGLDQFPIVLRHVREDAEEQRDSVYLFGRSLDGYAQIHVEIYFGAEAGSRLERAIAAHREHKNEFRLPDGSKLDDRTCLPEQVSGFASHVALRCRSGRGKTRWIAHGFHGMHRSVLLVFQRHDTGFLTSDFFKVVQRGLKLADVPLEPPFGGRHPEPFRIDWSEYEADTSGVMEEAPPERPLSSEELQEVRICLEQGWRELGLDPNNATPKQIAARVQEFLGELAANERYAKRKALQEAALFLGCVWAEAVKRELRWEWAFVGNDEDGVYAIVAPRRDYIIYPMVYALGQAKAARKRASTPTMLLLFNMLVAGNLPRVRAKKYRVLG